MKKVIGIILILVVAAAAWFYMHRPKETEVPKVTIQKTTAQPDPSNATFQFEDGPITLNKGRAETPVAPGSQLTQEVILTDTVAYGDLNDDDKPDTAVLLVQSSAGSGVFVWLGAYVSGTVMYKGSKVAFIGDRITPKTISIKSGVITVNYLDRKDGEPFAAEPTVSASKQFTYKNGELIEK